MKASLNGDVHLLGATTQLRKSTPQTDSEGSVMLPSHAPSKLLFGFTMALKALEKKHSLSTYSPIYEA